MSRCAPVMAWQIPGRGSPVGTAEEARDFACGLYLGDSTA